MAREKGETYSKLRSDAEGLTSNNKIVVINDRRIKGRTIGP
jgi:hypothetical protein